MLHQTSGRIHNKNVSTHLTGNIKRGEGGLEAQDGAEGQSSVLGEGRCRAFPSSPPWTTPHPVRSDLALPFTFPSSGPVVAPTGHNAERGGSGLFALCTLDGEFLLGSGAGCLWAPLGGPVPPRPACPPPRPGTLKLMEDADKLLWSVQVDHQLFALEKLDVTVRGTFLPS